MSMSVRTGTKKED